MEIFQIRCKKCGRSWAPRVESPIKCPHCQTKEYTKKNAGTLTAKSEAPAAASRKGGHI